MNNTAFEGAANEWNVVVTRTEGDQTVLANYTGTATDGIMTVSDYYREVERTDIVIPEGEVDIHWTRTRQSGIYYTDDRASFDQSQGWDGSGNDEDQGMRDGYGDHGSFGGAAFADDAGLYNGLDFGSDGLLDTLVEYGREGPLSFTVSWTSADTEDGIGIYSPIVPDYYDPSIVDPDADASVGYTNTTSYSATLWATARANEPGRVHRSYSTDTDDVVTTHYSRSGTGSYLQSYVLKSTYDEMHSGTTGSWVEAAAIYDGAFTDTGSKSSSNGELRTASHMWSNSGTRSYSRSYAEIDGELQPGSVYQWRDGGKVLRSQSQLASNTGSSALHTARDMDFYIVDTPSDYSSFSGSFNATTTASTSVKAIFDSTRGYTWASSDTSPVWTDSGTHLRSFSGTAREADWDDGKVSQTFSDGNGDWATYSATASATHTTGHNYSTADGSFREVQVSMTSWTSAWNGVYYDHSIPDYYPDVGDDGDNTTHPAETTGTSLALVFDSPPIPGGSENPLYDAGPIPDYNANLDYLTDNPRLTEALSAIGGFLKDLVALKGPDQGSEFDKLGDASKLDRPASHLREEVTDNPAETNAGLQQNEVNAEVEKPKTGSQAQKKNPYVANDRIDTLTGPNDGNANVQYLDLGLNSGNANNVHMIGDGNDAAPSQPKIRMPKPSDDIDRGFGRKYAPEEIAFRRGLYKGGEDFDRETEVGRRNPFAKHPSESWQQRKSETQKSKGVLHLEEPPEWRGFKKGLGNSAIGAAIGFGVGAGIAAGLFALGVTITPFVAIGAGAAGIGAGIIYGGARIYQGFHEWNRAGKPAEREEAVEHLTEGGISLGGSLGGLASAVRHVLRASWRQAVASTAQSRRRLGEPIEENLGGHPNSTKPSLPPKPALTRTSTDVDPADLFPSHKSNKSQQEMNKLKKSIEKNGFIDDPDNPVSYVVVRGKKYIVDGHHRVKIAQQLGLKKIPAREVKLPFRGYNTEWDLFDWER